jgi:hypothetical protein
MTLRRVLLALVAAVTLGLPASTAAANPLRGIVRDQTTPTTLLEEVDLSDAGGVVPLPNSGRAPQASGDRGGWAQLALFGIMTAGLALVGVRITLATRQRARANAHNA